VPNLTVRFRPAATGGLPRLPPTTTGRLPRLPPTTTGRLPRLPPTTTGRLPRLPPTTTGRLPRLLPCAPLSLQARLEIVAPGHLRIDPCAPLSLPRLEIVAALSLSTRLKGFATRSLLRLGLLAARSLPRLELLAAQGLSRLDLLAALGLATRLGLHPALNLTRRLGRRAARGLPRRIDIPLVQRALTGLELSPPLNVSAALARRWFGVAHKRLLPTVLGGARIKDGLRDVVPALISPLPSGP
jgi:hypothetical protein